MRQIILKDEDVIGEGTYGCVLRKHKCKTNPDTEDCKIVNKIQIEKESSEREYTIGQVIQSIEDY